MHGAGRGDVVRAADDRAAIGEDGQYVAIDGEPQQEGVSLNLADARESVPPDSSSDNLVPGGGAELHGVATTQDGRRVAALAG